MFYDQENSIYSADTYLRFHLKGKNENMVKIKFVKIYWCEEFDIISSNNSIDILEVDLFDEEFNINIIAKSRFQILK